MDLISREAIKGKLEENRNLFVTAWEGQIMSNYDKSRMDEISACIGEVQNCPAAFEGMTYGEVMKAVLGIKDEQIEEAKYLICIYTKGNHHDPFMAVKREVWNSPYKELSVIFGTVGVSE